MTAKIVETPARLGLRFGRPCLFKVFEDHTPFNKRHGEVNSRCTLEAADTGESLSLTLEETTTTDSGRTASRTIAITLSAEDRTTLVELLLRVPHAQLVTYHTERSEFDSELEAKWAILMARELGVIPADAMSEIKDSYRHSAKNWVWCVEVGANLWDRPKHLQAWGVEAFMKQRGITND